MSKVAITGKGGVGKTSFASLMAYVLVEQGQQVYAIDADPNSTLAQALGFPADLASQVTPIVEMADLILTIRSSGFPAPLSFPITKQCASCWAKMSRNR